MAILCLLDTRPVLSDTFVLMATINQILDEMNHALFDEDYYRKSNGAYFLGWLFRITFC